MSESRNFLVERIEADLEAGTYGGRVVTRFPPEPNGYLHIGHAKAIVTDFGLAARYGGRTHLRFDDTNPTVEDVEYVEAIQRDIRWLGYDWGEHLYFASDYFPRLYAFAQRLVREGRAYVCSLSLEQIRATRGTVTEPGTPSPDRDRPPKESLALLERMRRGEFPDGAYTLRAKIDMAHPNMKMRDPLMYRIRNVPHHRTGDDWHIYPMYDFAHGLSDAIEGVTHSFCTLEFENNRPLYDWFVEALFEPPVPRQHEFARFNLSYVVLSKRRLIQLVTEGHVAGWDDPRMPTLAGLRRRGVPPEAIRALMERVGLSRNDSVVDVSLFEHTIREVLNERAPRRMGVLRPLEVVVTNWPEGRVDHVEADDWPPDVPREGVRTVPFTRRLFIERDDFAESPPPDWRRMEPGVEVRLMHGYLVTCDRVVKDDEGRVVRLEVRADLDSRGGQAPDGRKVRRTIHWVSASEGVRCTVRLVDRLFTLPRPDDHADGFLAALNPDSLEVLDDAIVEPAVRRGAPGDRFQLVRSGYVIVDPVDTTDDRLVLHQIVPLKDSWSTRAVAPEPEPEVPRKAPGRKRTRRSASEQLDALIAERPEIGERLDALADAGVSDEDAATIAVDDLLHRLYREALGAGAPRDRVVVWLVNTLKGALKDRDPQDIHLTGAHLATLVGLVEEGEITSKVARKVLPDVIETGTDPEALIDERGLRPIRDPERLRGVVAQVLADHPDEVAAFREGNARLRGFFVGQVMKRTGGKADPKVLQRVLGEALGG